LKLGELYILQLRYIGYAVNPRGQGQPCVWRWRGYRSSCFRICSHEFLFYKHNLLPCVFGLKIHTHTNMFWIFIYICWLG